jgi:hypothetical protein
MVVTWAGDTVGRQHSVFERVLLPLEPVFPPETLLLRSA